MTQPTSSKIEELVASRRRHGRFTTAQTIIDWALGFYSRAKRDIMDNWREFLEGRHEDLIAKYPDVAQAVADAWRWERPIGPDGRKAERHTPPAISVTGERYREVLRAVVMLSLSAEEREAAIEESYLQEKEARDSAVTTALRRGGGQKPAPKISFEDLGVSIEDIEFD